MANQFIKNASAYAKKETDDEGNIKYFLEVYHSSIIDEEYRIVVIPNPFKTRNLYQKRLIEGSLDLLTDVTQSLSLNKMDYKSNISDKGINIDFVNMLKALGMFTGYIVNTTSWEKQKMMDYDRAELKNRLQKVISLL